MGGLKAPAAIGKPPKDRRASSRRWGLFRAPPPTAISGWEYTTRLGVSADGAIGSDDFFRYNHDGHVTDAIRWLIDGRPKPGGWRTQSRSCESCSFILGRPSCGPIPCE